MYYEWMDGQMDECYYFYGWTGKQMDTIHIVSDIWFYIQLQTEIADKQKENNNLKDSLQQTQSSNKQKEKDMESSIANMQQDLAKRAEQVMELDELLRKHQAETTAKRLQLERNLAQRQADLRTKTQELEDISRRYAQSQKVEREKRERERERGIYILSLCTQTIQDLQEELHNQPIYKPHPPNKVSHNYTIITSLSTN